MKTITKSAPAKQAPIRPDEAESYGRVSDWMKQRHGIGVDLVGAAKVAGLSPFHFHRRFSLWAGLTLKRMATRLQIERAKELLLAGRPLFDVGQECGFAHQSHFTSRFRQATGTTPARWLREQKQRAELRAENVVTIVWIIVGWVALCASFVLGFLFRGVFATSGQSSE